jgi:transposase
MVIAQSRIPAKPGQQRKHDKHDAAPLARLYRAGELTTVRIPSEAEERVRDLVRCREALQREVLKSRHYILKFLARVRLSRGHELECGALQLAAPLGGRQLAARCGRSGRVQRVPGATRVQALAP